MGKGKKKNTLSITFDQKDRTQYLKNKKKKYSKQEKRKYKKKLKINQKRKEKKEHNKMVI